MTTTSLTPEPPDKDNNEEIKQLIRKTIEELQLRLRFAQSYTQESLAQLTNEVFWDVRLRAGLSLEPPLHAQWHNFLTNYALTHQSVFAHTAPVSSAPIPLGEEKETGETIYLPYPARTSGVYLIGQAGYGKTNLIQKIVLGDINNGFGVVVMDSHGELTRNIIAQLPQDRLKDVVLVEPGLMANQMGLNFIEKTSSGIEVDLSRTMDYFDRRWGHGSAHPSTGPRMMNVLGMAIHVLYRHELTMAELPHFLQDQALRKRLVATLEDTGPDHYVKLFFSDFEKQERRKQQEWVSPVQNKVYELMRSRHMLLMLAQSKTTLHFRELMDESKIVLIHLDKNLVGGMENVGLIGTALIGEFMRAAFSRKAGDPDNRYCSLFVDEFENFVSSEFVEAIPQIRKYGVGVVLANQVYAQMDKVLQQIVDGMACHFTFRCTVDDSQHRAPLYQRAPDILYKEQAKKAPVTSILTHLLSGTHGYTNQRVVAWIQLFEPIYHDRALRDFLKPIDAHYYQVMTGNNGSPDPYLPPPNIINPYIPPFILDPTINQVLYKEQPDLFAAFLPTVAPQRYAPLYWQYHEKQLVAAEKEQENEEAKTELDRINSRWAGLFAAHTEQELQNAFSLWEEEARTMLRDEILCVAEEFLQRFGLQIAFSGKEIDWSQVPKRRNWPNWSREEEENRSRIIHELSYIPDIEQFHIAQRHTPEYAQKRTEHFEKLWSQFEYLKPWSQFEQQSVVDALGFSCDTQTLRSLLTLDRLQWNVTYAKAHTTPTREYEVSFTPNLVKNKYNSHAACDMWRLVEGQETLLLPFIEPAIEQAITIAKPLFEAHIRFLRDVQQALADVPIAVTTSETEQVPSGTKSTMEMRNEMAQLLVNLPLYHCFVRLGHSDTAAKPLVHTRKPEPGVGKKELEERIAVIREQTKQYGRDPGQIEQELEARRVSLGIVEAKSLPETGKGQNEKKAIPLPLTTEKEAAPSRAATPHTLARMPKETTPDTYLELIYYLSNLTLRQAVKLVGQDGQTKEELGKITKREQSKINRLIGAGQVEHIEPEATAFLKTGGRAPLVYRVTKKGYDTLRKEKGLKPINTDGFSPHSFKTNEVCISLLRGVQETSYTLMDFLHEKQFRQTPIQLGTQGLEPDAWLCLSQKGQLQSIFVEIDLKSEGSSKLKDKISRYCQAIDKKAHQGFQTGTIKIVFINPHGKDTDTDRLVRIIEEAVERKYAPSFFVASLTIEDIAPQELLTGSLFRKPFEKIPVPLLP